MNLPEPQILPFETLISDIKKGSIKIPQFQRDFVWSRDKSALLLDSILRGFPIGTFILWKTKESLRSIKNLGGVKLPDPPRGDFTYYVLDGQQRLASLYACVEGLKIKREVRDEDFSKLYIDLTAQNEDRIVILDKEKNSNEVISVHSLLNADLSTLNKYPKEFHDKLDDYKRCIRSYSFSTVVVKDVPIDIATEIFTRINVTGTELTMFEIMVAKTYDEERKFDLARQFARLKEKWQDVDYETIPPAVLLQAVAIVLKKECKKKNILQLDKTQFINAWPKVIEAIELAIDYFRDFYRIPVSRLLPYSALLVPFAYFFYTHTKRPTGDRKDYLQDFFWRCSLTGRYSYSLEAKLAQDIKRIDLILEGRKPKYDQGVDTSPKFITDNGRFSVGRSYVKAILCMLASKDPKSFGDNSTVRIGNDWLKQVNSKNYHHFFPRAFLENMQVDKTQANHIVNITIVDDSLNKKEIRDKAPSQYMKIFKKRNKNIEDTMKTHLIDLERFGIWENDYDLFFEMRCKAIAKELKKYIIAQPIDEHGQEVDTDDRDTQLEQEQVI